MKVAQSARLVSVDLYRQAILPSEILRHEAEQVLRDVPDAQHIEIRAVAYREDDHERTTRAVPDA